jgi:hypothetical protein
MVQCFASQGRTFYPGKMLQTTETTGQRAEVGGRTLSAEEYVCADLSLMKPALTKSVGALGTEKQEQDVTVPPN